MFKDSMTSLSELCVARLSILQETTPSPYPSKSLPQIGGPGYASYYTMMLVMGINRGTPNFRKALSIDMEGS